MLLFLAKAILICRASHLIAEIKTFNVSSYDTIKADNQTYHLPDDIRMRYMLFYSRVLWQNFQKT